jgi:hypothetical protein
MQNGKGDRNRIGDRRKFREGWDYIFEKCSDHPNYRAVCKPLAKCPKCWELYRRKHPLRI